MEYNLQFYQASADYVNSKYNKKLEVALILGTGLGDLAKEIEDPIVIPYGDIPNFLTSTVHGHAGKLILGTLSGKNVVCMSGRFHYYEGYSYEQLATPIRLFHLLGVKCVIVTNAAGAVNTNYRPGDVMIISDHINLVGATPMRGKNEAKLGERFFDIGNAYNKTLRELARERAKFSSLTVHEGVYQFFVGPHFETPAEIKAARILGADAVGMSTVTEVLTAAHCKLPLLGFSLLTNMAAGVLDQPLSGEEVEEIGKLSGPALRLYIMDILSHLDEVKL